MLPNVWKEWTKKKSYRQLSTLHNFYTRRYFLNKIPNNLRSYIASAASWSWKLFWPKKWLVLFSKQLQQELWVSLSISSVSGRLESTVALNTLSSFHWHEIQQEALKQRGKGTGIVILELQYLRVCFVPLPKPSLQSDTLGKLSNNKRERVTE